MFNADESFGIFMSAYSAKHSFFIKKIISSLWPQHIIYLTRFKLTTILDKTQAKAHGFLLYIK